MTQILLHKQELTEEQKSQLADSGVIAIRTDKPKDFKFLDLKVPQIEMNGMVWALIEALDSNSDYTGATELRRKFIKNLAILANEKRSEAKS